jgi:transposase-like protein
LSQHFLLSRQAKTLSLASVFRMTDEEAERTFRNVRWAATGGEPVCPYCGGLDAYEFRRARSAMLHFDCRACRKQFSITSGTLFASHKLPLRSYLAAIAVFCNEVKGKSMLAMSRELGLSYKASFVLCHKLREAMAAEIKGRMLGGEGTEVSVDGMYAGGYVKPSNLRENRRDRRLAENQSGKRQVVVIIRQHGGDSIPAVFRSESAALGFIRSHVKPGTVVNADEASSWDALHARFEMKRIDHGQAYSLDGACTNWAETYFSRLRRGEIGHHHHISGPYLVRYAQEAAFREDARRVANGEQVGRVAELAMTSKPSVDFAGYWQRHRTGA